MMTQNSMYRHEITIQFIHIQLFWEPVAIKLRVSYIMPNRKW